MYGGCRARELQSLELLSTFDSGCTRNLVERWSLRLFIFRAACIVSGRFFPFVEYTFEKAESPVWTRLACLLNELILAEMDACFEDSLLLYKPCSLFRLRVRFSFSFSLLVGSTPLGGLNSLVD